MSCPAEKNVAMVCSGAAERRPHAMVLEIEPSFVDRGAIVTGLSKGKLRRCFFPCRILHRAGVGA
jgi:hypothetical protein